MGLGKIFNDPSMMSKLENHPKTKGFMADPGFRTKVAQLQASGGTAGLQEMMGDPRMLTVLGVMMGIDIVSCSPHSSDEIPGLVIKLQALTHAGCNGTARGLERHAARLPADAQIRRIRICSRFVQL